MLGDLSVCYRPKCAQSLSNVLLSTDVCFLCAPGKWGADFKEQSPPNAALIFVVAEALKFVCMVCGKYGLVEGTCP